MPKLITLFLTDKLFYEIVNVASGIGAEFQNKFDGFSSDPSISSESEDNDGFYTSSLNSVSISEIKAKVTVKKVLIEENENNEKIKEMGILIVDL
jgi:hypothetical protein